MIRILIIVGIATLAIHSVILIKPIASLPGRDFVSEKRCICPAVYAPVCASNGVTYDSKCHFHCAQIRRSDLKIIFKGKCNEM